MSYDGERKLTRTLRNSVPIETDNGVFSSTLVPTPYNLEFQLTIMTKYTEDGTKILEQILPYFQPDWTPSVKLVDNLDYYLYNIGNSNLTIEEKFKDRHNKYCKNQKLNPHTPAMMETFGVNKQVFAEFMDEVLFPEQDD
jgi:hypothetical protein